ncbi:MAG: dihydroorotate dehydrogenase [Candidatus Moraniibacteriota bacterium]
MPHTFSLGNAAGTCRTVEGVAKLIRSAVDTVTLGSFTLTEKEGNPGTNYYRDARGTSINALGLPNKGLGPYHLTALQAFVGLCHGNQKQISVSITSLDLIAGETAQLASICIRAGLDHIEFDASCSNVWIGGKQKRILSFDLQALESKLDVLVRLRRMSVKPFGIRLKLSPYSDPVLLKEVASLIFQCGGPHITLVLSNTFPNALKFIDSDLPDFRYAIPFGKHYGGLGGDAIRAIALGQVAQFRDALPDNEILCVGGISGGRHIAESLRVGADGVQVGTAYYDCEDPRIFS